MQTPYARSQQAVQDLMEVNLEGKANFYCNTSADNLMYIHSKGEKMRMDFAIGVQIYFMT